MSDKALKPPKQKAINFELIPPIDGIHEPEPYRILRDIREKYHPELARARIALAWRMNLKRDQDGHLILGRCVKASDLQRELADWDFVILLNREVWCDVDFTIEKKRTLIDHELCHADAARDKDGFPKLDQRDRYVWRTRKHDIEEFRDIVKRHGCYKADLIEFAKALLQKRAMPLLENLDQVSADSLPSERQASNGESRLQGETYGDATGKTQPVSAESQSMESSSEEIAKTRKAKAKAKMLGQDAILPDKRTSFPHGHNSGALNA